MKQYTARVLRLYVAPLTLAATLVTAGVMTAPRTAEALSLGDVVNLFIALGIIAPDKADTARQVVNTLPSETVPTTTGVCPYVWSRNLTIGSYGTDVLALQRYLNSALPTPVAYSGAGSPGNETQYYGALTAAAVTRYQNAHAATVLAPIGLSAGTGYFGTLTRASMNAACTAPTTPTVPTTPTTPTTPTVPTTGTEASVWRYKVLNTPSGQDVEEGDTKQVLGVQFDVTDAAVTLSRADVAFQAVDTVLNYRPWQYLRTVSLWYDGHEVASQRVDTQSAWNNLGNRVYSLRFSGLDTVIPEGDDPTFYVEVQALQNIDSSDTPQRFDVWVPDNGFRLADAVGVQHYVGNDAMTRDITLEQAGQTTELNVHLADSNPAAGVLAVPETHTSAETPLLVARLEAEDGDVTISSIPVTIYTYDNGASQVPFSNVFADAELVGGGHTFTDYTVTHTDRVVLNGVQTTATTLTFDTSDWVIREGDSVDLTLNGRFVRQNNNFAEGTRVRASLTHDDVAAIDAEDRNRIPEDRLSGSAIGETQTLRTEGVTVTPVSFSADATTRSALTQSTASFTATFDVTAFGNTFYLPQGAGWLAANGTTTLSGTADGGAFFSVLNAANAPVETGSAPSVLTTSNATLQNGAYVLYDGQTRRFTVQVTYDPTAAGFYRLRLDDVAWRPTGVANADATRQTLYPEQAFSSDFVYVQN